MADTWSTATLGTDSLRLVFLPGIGGRLWDVVFRGRSLLFRNPDLAGRAVDLDRLRTLPTRSPQFAFPLWGGEKTWIAPDSAWDDAAPFPVLDSGPCAVVSRDTRHIRMRSAPCPSSGLQVERLIRLRGADGFTIRHRVTNVGPRTRFAGIWSVMMVNRPARIGLVIGPGGTLAPVFGDATGCVDRQGAVAVVDCRRAQEFKLGTQNPTGRTFMRCETGNAPVWLICDTPAARPGDRFAHGNGFEVFNSADYPYGEAEWHAPARTLAPGDRLDFTQAFSVRTEAGVSSDRSLAPQQQELVSCMSS